MEAPSHPFRVSCGCLLWAARGRRDVAAAAACIAEPVHRLERNLLTKEEEYDLYEKFNKIVEEFMKTTCTPTYRPLDVSQSEVCTFIDASLGIPTRGGFLICIKAPGLDISTGKVREVYNIIHGSSLRIRRVHASSTSGELLVARVSASESLWIKAQLLSLGMTQEKCIKMMTDSKNISSGNELAFKKPVEVSLRADYLVLHSLVENGEIILQFIYGRGNPSDPLTKIEADAETLQRLRQLTEKGTWSAAPCRFARSEKDL